MQITEADIRRLAPRAKAEIIVPVVAAMPATLPAYGITTALRFCHFIAQAAHETGGFTLLNEGGGSVYFEKHYGSDTAVGRRLGNTQAGDGARYHGRGIFQLTGRANYGVYGKKLGLNLVDHPELAAVPATSLAIACLYWASRGLNRFADADNVVEITRRINGGENGLAERQRYLAMAKTIWPASAFAAPATPPLPHLRPDAPAPVEGPAPVDAPPPTAPAAPGPIEPAPAAPIPPAPQPVEEDPMLETLPAIATDVPSAVKPGDIINGVTSTVGGSGIGYTIAQNPNVLWIGLALLAAGLVLAIVFRQAISAWLSGVRR